VRLYPAIDILGGNAVRLVKGDFDAKKVYDEDPLSAARGWTGAGARALHVVDLDGARTGMPVNLEHLRRIAGLGVPVQYGGGLRSRQAIDEALAAGAERVILGTAAFTDEALLERSLERHGPGRVAVSVDVRGRRVATAGWTETTEVSAAQAIASLCGRGVKELVFTSVDRDGMLGGQDDDEVLRVAEAAEAAGHARVVYSGGIGELGDLRARAELAAGHPSLTGVIVGKALYEGRFTIAQARAVLGD
jgi:phosphoribosylformimino-5-aminoimidazole carboxamide ribotide isomerase